MTGLIVHEWAERSGGAENVVDEFARLLPTAALQVLWNNADDRFPIDVTETWLSRTPLRRSKALALPILPLVWRQLRSTSKIDWMLISSHLFAHHAHIAQQPGIPKLVYAHTPARYIWEPDRDNRGRGKIVRLAASAFKPLDRKRAGEAASIATNSHFTARRVEQAWHRDSTVIYPPVNVDAIHRVNDWATLLEDPERSQFDQLPEVFLLGASRFVEYKGLHHVISAGEAASLPVVIAGAGPDHKRLMELADRSTVPVHFVLSPSNTLLYALYQKALAYIFPAVEDFGIMPVEAMAAGAPVIVPREGGASESVTLLSGGATIESDSPSSWRHALDEALEVDRTALMSRTKLFSAARFRNDIHDWMTSTLRIESGDLHR